MTWGYCKFSRHPIAAEKSEMRGRNTTLLHYHYRFDPELGKGGYVIFGILCECPACVVQLDKDWLPNIAP